MEAVGADVIEPEDGKLLIHSVYLEPRLFRATENYLVTQSQLGVEGPRVVMVSLLAVRGYRIMPNMNERRWHFFGEPIPQQDLILPDVLVTNPRDDVTQLLRPVLDILWQAAGWERCYNYDDQGQWSLG